MAEIHIKGKYMISNQLKNRKSTWIDSHLVPKDMDKLNLIADILKLEIKSCVSIQRWEPRYTEHLELIVLNTTPTLVLT